ncbi:hypothetical protein, partial [Dysgonomonas sp. HGC4]
MKNLFLLLIFSVLMSPLAAQVGINTENPNTLTEFDVRNLLANGTDTIPKGIMIPRMSELQRDQIDVSN